MIRKPMLAASMKNSKDEPMSFSDLTYPLAASIKLDGIRGLKVNQQTLSRSFKPIPNLYIQSQMRSVVDGLDGELVALNVDGSDAEFNVSQSKIMSKEGEPQFVFYAFDYVSSSLNMPYMERIAQMQELQLPSFVRLVIPRIINSEQELLEFEEEAIAQGYEGLMTRSLNGPYKCGRATFKSQDLVKIKRFADSEAEIIGFEEKFTNQNEAQLDELGHSKRSSSKEGLIPANTLGAFIVRDIYSKHEFKIGTGKGLNDSLRSTIWLNKDAYIGKLIKYNYQEIGTKDAPRIPSFQGFRSALDL